MTADARRTKEANSRFHRLMDRTEFHIRVPNEQGLSVTLVGHAADLHGPEGVCSCCHGRSSGVAAKAQAPADEWSVFVSALRTAARDGRVHQADVRPLIRGLIEPKHIGQQYRRAIREGLIREAAPERSDDEIGRNAGRWEPTYDYLGSAA